MSQPPTITPKFEFSEKVAASFLKSKSGAGGLHEFLGFETVDVGPGTMQGRFEVRPELMTPIGNMHGGVLAAFCDHLLGTVCYPVMKKGQWAATTEFKLNLTRPVRKAPSTAMRRSSPWGAPRRSSESTCTTRAGLRPSRRAR